MLQPAAPAKQVPLPQLTGCGLWQHFRGRWANGSIRPCGTRILSLAYRPGEILRKPEICDALGVSRSPVADAVARLQAEGLVDVVPQAGTFVARFSMQEIREGAFLREAIEVAAIERVAAIITDEQVHLLRRNLTVQAALLGDGDIPGFYAMDAALHEPSVVLHRLSPPGAGVGNRLGAREPGAPADPAGAGPHPGDACGTPGDPVRA